MGFFTGILRIRMIRFVIYFIVFIFLMGVIANSVNAQTPFVISPDYSDRDINTNSGLSSVSSVGFQYSQGQLETDNIYSIRAPFSGVLGGGCVFDELVVIEDGIDIYNQPVSFGQGLTSYNDDSDSWTEILINIPFPLSVSKSYTFNFTKVSSSCYRPWYGLDLFSTPNLKINGSGFDTAILEVYGFETRPPVIDIMGSTTPLDIINSVTRGVQDTTQPIVPVAGAVVGVPLAFVIGRKLLQFIMLSV